jgi:hypothetical protein
VRHLVIEYVPAVVGGLFGDLLDRTTLLRTPVVSSVVERVVPLRAARQHSIAAIVVLPTPPFMLITETQTGPLLAVM